MHVSAADSPHTDGQKLARFISSVTSIVATPGHAGKGPKPQKRHACPFPPALQPSPPHWSAQGALHRSSKMHGSAGPAQVAAAETASHWAGKAGGGDEGGGGEGGGGEGGGGEGGGEGGGGEGGGKKR